MFKFFIHWSFFYMHLHLFPWYKFLDVEMLSQRVCIFKRFLNYRMLVNYPGNLIWAWYSLVAAEGHSGFCLICLIKLSLSSIEVNVMKTIWLFHKYKHSFAFKGLFIGSAVYAKFNLALWQTIQKAWAHSFLAALSLSLFFFFSI